MERDVGLLGDPDAMEQYRQLASDGNDGTISSLLGPALRKKPQGFQRLLHHQRPRRRHHEERHMAHTLSAQALPCAGGRLL